MRFSQGPRPLVVDCLFGLGNDSAKCLEILSERLTESVDGIVVRNRKPDSVPAIGYELVLHAIDQNQLLVRQSLRELVVGVQHKPKPFENRGRVLGDELLCPVVQRDVRDVGDNGLALGKSRGQLRILAERVGILYRVDRTARPPASASAPLPIPC